MIGATALAVLGFAGAARAADPVVTLGEDGKTEAGHRRAAQKAGVL